MSLTTSLKDWLRLVRAPLAPTAACDVVACALLARGPGLAVGDGAPALSIEGLWQFGALAGTSVLVYAAGMAGNDLADRARDRTLHPERPLPSGRIGVAAAVVVTFALAAAALALGGGPLGSRLCVAAALVFAAVYNGATKHALALGAASMGLVRAANASTGVLPLVLAGHASPVALAAPLLISLYSAGVTVLSTAEEQPERERARRWFARVVAGVAFSGAALVAMAGAGGLVFSAFVAFAVVLSVSFGRVPKPGPVKRQVLEMLLALYWLDAALACGMAPGAEWVVALAAFGIAFALILGSQFAVRALR